MLSATMALRPTKIKYPILLGWYPPSAEMPSTVALFWNADCGLTLVGASGIGQVVNSGPLAERGEWREYRGEVTLINS